MSQPRSVVAAYGLPAFGYAAVGVMVAIYLPEFYADNVGVPLGVIGAITTILQVFDAITDPLLGFCSDRCQSRYGRRRPFVLGGSASLSVAFVAIFVPPQDSDQEHQIAYVTVVGFALFLSWTASRVPYISWGLELARSHDEKTRVSVSRELGFIAGAMCAAVLPVVLERLVTDEFQRLAMAAGTWAAVIWLATALCCLWVPDAQHSVLDSVAGQTTSRRATAAMPQRSLPVFLRQIIGNKTVAIFFVQYVLYNSAQSINALMFPFFVKHVMQREDIQSLLVAIYVAIAALVVPVWYLLSVRFEKKILLMVAMTMQTLMLTVTFFFIRPGDTGFYAFLVCCAGMAFGGAGVLKFSILADVVDVECLRSGGYRDEGKLFGLFDITTKLAASGISAVCFAAIDKAGYEEGGTHQSSDAKLAIRVCYSLVPAVQGWIALCTMSLYPLNRAGHGKVLDQLAAMDSDHDPRTQEPCSEETAEGTTEGLAWPQTAPEGVAVDDKEGLDAQNGDHNDCHCDSMSVLSI